MPEETFRIVVLISGNGSNLQAIIDQVNNGVLPVKICAVVSNRNDAFGLTRARQANIPTIVVDHTEFETRESFDKAMMQQIDSYQPDLIVLAGFMRILSDEFVDHYAGKMINIHPSLLPKYQGLDTHQRAIDAGEKEHGASVHYVTRELDSGPLILQSSVPVRADDTTEGLKQRVHEVEHRLYPEAIRRIATGEITWHDNMVYHNENPLNEQNLRY